jgi:CDP-glucose 4,6-dehydratase
VVEAFWKNKKVFLTGHTGFKGSWLSIWLNKMGADVTGYSLPAPTDPSLFESAKVESLVRSNLGDIRNYENLQKVMLEAKPEIVIHMAAQPLVRYSYAEPIETYTTNVLGTVHVLETSRKLDTVKAIVNVTTDKCYENKEWIWGYRENEPMGGFDPYSSSKACSEIVTAAYQRSYFTGSAALASARAGNVIGGGDWGVDRLVPDIMRAIAKDEVVKIRNPKSIRPWQHVLEPLSGYLTLAQNLYFGGQKFSQAFNFGPIDSDAKEVEWIVQKLTSGWGKKAKYVIEQDPKAPHEAHFLKLDCTKAKDLLCWQPRWGLEKTLSSIIHWHSQYLENPNMAREISLAQITDYLETSKAKL